MYHFGVIKALIHNGLCPHVISGTSGGSIVAAFIATLRDAEEATEAIQSNLATRHGVKWFPSSVKMVVHYAQHGTLMDNDQFAQTTAAYFGDTTFAEAYAVSRRAVSIQVSIGAGHGFVLNHLTSPHVLLRTAVCASCALPGLMRPFELLAKDASTGTGTGALVPFHPPGVSSFDGTITADIPAARLTELFNCNNFIVSQVNPHLNFVLHLAEEDQARGRTKTARGGHRRKAVQKLLRVANFLLLNMKYGIQKLLEVDLLDLRIVRTLQGILVQNFRGHITVLPSLELRDYCSIIANPTPEDMTRFLRRGEAATWPHMEAIRHTMAVESALTAASKKLSQRHVIGRRRETAMSSMSSFGM